MSTNAASCAQFGVSWLSRLCATNKCWV